MSNAAAPGYVLFVCTANTCRSPTAEALLRDHLDRRGFWLSIRSAGFLEAGRPMDHTAHQALRERGLDADDHRSAIVDRALIDGAFLVLTMTAGQVLSVSEVADDALPRTFTLREFVGLAEAAGGLDHDVELGELTVALHEHRDRRSVAAVDTPFDIADPYGQGRAAADRAVEEIETEIKRLADLLIAPRR